MNALTPDTRRAKALRRLIAIKEAEQDILAYTRFTMPDFRDVDDVRLSRYQVARHHRIVAQTLHMLEAGQSRHVIINLGPRHGKTELASKRFISWMAGRHPDRSLIFGTYNNDYAGDNGRAVRDILTSEQHQQVFPDFYLKDGSASANRIETMLGGQLSFVGRGGSITGRGGHGIIIDDPIKDRQEADSKLIRDQLWTWFTQVVMTRRMTGDSWVLIIQCMTGDTPVLLPNGDEKPLAQIRPGDKVASYTPFGIVAATVNKFAPQGPDEVFAIRMKSGITVRANARHPFLVDTDTGLKWQRTATLEKGSRILRVTGENGEIHAVRLTAATSQSVARASANPITTKTDGLEAFVRLLSTNALVAKRIFDTAITLALTNMTASSLNKAVFAQYAGSRLPQPILEAIGQESCAWITVMTEGMSGGYSATTAISPLATGSGPLFSERRLNTLSAIHDEVESVTPAGVAEVFDIEVEGTANFIANGLVSHNTRWHEDDLVGRLTDPMNAYYNEAEAKKWLVVDLPALALENDPLGRKPGEALWPEKFPVDYLEAQRALDPRGFQALYQGRPSAEEGAFFKNEYIKTYKPDELPRNLRIYIASDHAVSSRQDRDKTCLIPVGVDEQDNIYVLPDVWWRGEDANVVVEAMLAKIKQHKPLYWWAERGVISKSLGPFLRKRMQEESAYASIIEITPIVDKQTRAQSIQGRMAMGKVFFPENAVWWPEARDQILKFPHGAHDDFVDALAYIGLGLTMQVSAPKQSSNTGGPRFGTFGWLKQQTRDDERRERARRDTAGF